MKTSITPKDPSLPVGRRMSLERRIMIMTLFAALPAGIVSLYLLWSGDYTPKVRWTLTLLIVGVWWALAVALKARVIFPLQTISNMLMALREGDYSIRIRGATREDALGEISMEVNELGETLRTQRLGALEATNLLRKVMAEIEVAIFAFDGERKLKLVNRAGERLLAQAAERLRNRTAEELGLAECLEGAAARTLQKTFPGGVGRWGMRRSTFREGGLRHQLLVLTDLSQALREEERQAWKRLVRVIGHELNNSLAPIKSMSATMASLLTREPRPGDWEEDMQRGLSVIEARVEALSRFMEAYARLARLPQPRFRPTDVGAWIQRVAGLETRLAVRLVPGPETSIEADGDQLDQLLINLIRNAVDAALETGGGVRVGWNKSPKFLQVWVEDEGPGLSNTANLFVPFFTTKPGGTGIGLVLSQQIAEAHGGTLTLMNRATGRGCVARLRLPLWARVKEARVSYRDARAGELKITSSRMTRQLRHQEGGNDSVG